jgi:hypothetical protein
MNPETIRKATTHNNRTHVSNGNVIYRLSNRVWKKVTIVGMMLASLLVIQEAMA